VLCYSVILVSISTTLQNTTITNFLALQYTASAKRPPIQAKPPHIALYGEYPPLPPPQIKGVFTY